MKKLFLVLLLLPIYGLAQLNILHTANDCPIDDVLRVCVETEPYVGFYKYETTYSWCSSKEKTLRGEIEMVLNNGGQYFTSDFSFGTWNDCYGDTVGPLGTVQMYVECSFIIGISGTDKFGDIWSSDNFSFENNSISFNWFNSYGDFATTTLTPIDGRILSDPTEVIEDIGYQILWSTGETTPTIETNESGLFEVTVTSNATGISESTAITIDNSSPSFNNECNGELLEVSYFLDLNENGVQDSDEISLNVFESFIGFSPDYLLKGYKGYQTELYVLDPQTYIVSSIYTNYETTLQSNTITITKGPEVDKLNVGLVSVQDVESVDVVINANQFPRCETIVPFQIRAINNGTVAYSGEITVDIDPLLEIVSMDTEAISQVGNTLTWQIDIDNPTEYVDIIVYLKLPSSDHLGEIFCLTPVEETFTKDFNAYCFELACAYDPNDKHGVPFRGSGNNISNNESLDYTIRFENLGNDTALNIKVVDRLNTNYDLRSFKMVNSSHKITKHWIDQNRQLHVEFEDIYLPSIEHDSTLNKGFFQFSISLIPDLDENTKIRNAASIFFDQNDAIVTNTTEHTIASLGISSVSQLNNIDFSISPNPVSSLLKITVKSTYTKGNDLGFATIRDVRGNIVLTPKDLTKEIDVSSLETGLYFIQIVDNEGRGGLARFVKI